MDIYSFSCKLLIKIRGIYVCKFSKELLVPVKKLSPPAVIEKNRDLAPLDLVNGNISLQSREEVKKLLPDIMGKALARIWIDPNFHKDFQQIRIPH